MTPPHSPDQAPAPLREDLQPLVIDIAKIALKYGVGPTEGVNICNGFGGSSSEGYEDEAAKAWENRPGAAPDSTFDDDVTAIENEITQHGGPLAFLEALESKRPDQ